MLDEKDLRLPNTKKVKLVIFSPIMVNSQIVDYADFYWMAMHDYFNSEFEYSKLLFGIFKQFNDEEKKRKIGPLKII